MASRTLQVQRKQTRELADILDRLVSVDLDLEPICRVTTDPTELAVAADSIASARDTLRAAIRDLREIVHHIDGGRYLVLAAPVRRDDGHDTAQK